MSFTPHASPALRGRHANALDAPQLAPIANPDDEISVAFVGTYGPRRCGIATFTADLAAAVAGDDSRVSPMVLALTEPAGRYQYPAEVKFEIRQEVKGDYARAAEFVNFNRVRLVCIQHEYGIFGGDDGGYILDFVQALRVPVIVTLHTVLKHPSENQAAIVRKLAAACELVIVMSQVAKGLLASAYGIDGANVRIIPHGIPVMELEPNQQALKAKFGVAGRRVLLTFGLLGPNKGIETVIRALPTVVEPSRISSTSSWVRRIRRFCAARERLIARCWHARPRNSVCASTSCFMGSSFRLTSCVGIYRPPTSS